METKLVLCDCGSAEHQLILSYCDDEEPEFQMMYVQIHLTTYKNIVKRILRAVRYVFGYKSKYGDWDEIVVSPQTAVDVIAFIERFIGGAAEKEQKQQ